MKIEWYEYEPVLSAEMAALEAEIGRRLAKRPREITLLQILVQWLECSKAHAMTRGQLELIPGTRRVIAQLRCLGDAAASELPERI